VGVGFVNDGVKLAAFRILDLTHPWLSAGGARRFASRPVC